MDEKETNQTTENAQDGQLREREQILMSTRRFVEHVRQGYAANQRYCFILGSGASYTSGISTGLDLMPKWRDFLMQQPSWYIEECAKDCGIPEGKWKPLFQKDYQLQSEDYFTLFDLRYAGMPIAAYHDLQELMKDAEPSIGYYMLAVLMDNTENKLVITTNFDSLVEDVLYLYHAKHPLVAGHESLATFIGTAENEERPVVAKVHRDLILRPLNRERELQKLADGWEASLRTALSRYTPIVIGYSGGDQTLMNLLERMNLDTIYWCSLRDRESGRIEKLLRERPRGYLVKIKGFDEVMFALVARMTKDRKFDTPLDRMEDLFRSRRESYQKQYLKMNDQVLDETTDRSPENGGTAAKPMKSDASGDASHESPDRNADTDEGSGLDLLDKLAGSEDPKEESKLMRVAALRRNAVRLYFERKTSEALEECMHAIEIQPDDADLYDLKGTILHNSGRYEEALADSDEAVRLNPQNARYRHSRGVTLHELGRYEEALVD